MELEQQAMVRKLPAVRDLFRANWLPWGSPPGHQLPLSGEAVMGLY